jgi:hypothetical protein
VLTITPPTTSGYSQVFLVEVAYSDVDGGATVLPFFNAANPEAPFAGPGNSGGTNYTVRQGVLTISLKAGIAAPTGSQLTPSADPGFTALYAITVPNGATQITSSNWTTVSGAPFITPLTQISIPSISVTGRVLRTSVFTNVGGTQYVSVNGGTPTTTGASTFTALAGTGSVLVEVLSGGGAGGAIPSTNGSQCTAAGGGAGGNYGAAWLASGFSGGITITVGGGGAGASAGSNNGGNGGSSSFGSVLSCTGGAGGAHGTVSTSETWTPNGVGGASGGTISGANLYQEYGQSGGFGSLAYGQACGYGAAAGGGGGSSFYGIGASPFGVTQTANPLATQGTGYGSGSSGVASNLDTVSWASAAGQPGIVIVKEFA